MKKFIFISAIAIFTLASFTKHEEIEKPTLKRWNYWCANGSSGSFLTSTSCDQSCAETVTHNICN